MKHATPLLPLFLTFLKIGVFTFGGGYAMIAIIENICVERNNWIMHDEMMDITIIAESTPGPMAINCATYVGYKQAGFIGALIATLGIVLPSFVIIYIISMFLNHFLEYAFVASAFKGIRVAVGLLILNVGMNMTKKMKKNRLSCGIMICSCILMLLVNFLGWNFSSIAIMLCAGIFSLSLFLLEKGGRRA